MRSLRLLFLISIPICAVAQAAQVAYMGVTLGVIAVCTAVQLFGFTLRLATPDGLRPPEDLVAWARAQGARIELTSDPEAAVAGARCVVADTWVSMSDDPNESRHNLLAPYRVTNRLMGKAEPDALFMHCLPAHRGEEVSADVIDGPQSVVWDEAENRLHVQKALLEYLVLGRLDAQ